MAAEPRRRPAASADAGPASRRAGWDGAVRPARPPRRLRLVLGLAGLLVAVGIASAPLASAHADLASTSPAAGGHLTGSPASVTLRFTEAVTVAATTVTAVSGGQQYPLTLRAGAAPDAVVGTVPASLPAGALTLQWRAVAADDGHVTSGSLRLTRTGAAPAVLTRSATAAPAGPDTWGVQGAFALVRMLSYLAIAVLCGGLAFLAVAWPEGAEVARSRRLLFGAWAVGIVTAVLGAGLEGATVVQGSIGSAVHPSVIDRAMQLGAGRVWIGKALLFGVAFPVLWALRTQGARAVRSAGWRVAAAAIGLALVRTPGLSSHAEQGPHPDWGSVADLLHLAGVAVWIGGLAFLLLVVLPRRRPEELRVVVPRFSTTALVSVAAIFAGGSFLSWQLVGSVHGLTHTHFGHLLVLKLIAFAAVLGAAQLSKGWVAGRLNLAVALGGDARTVRPFVASVGIEAVLALTVLMIASVLVGSNPVR